MSKTKTIGGALLVLFTLDLGFGQDAEIDRVRKCLVELEGAIKESDTARDAVDDARKKITELEAQVSNQTLPQDKALNATSALHAELYQTLKESLGRNRGLKTRVETTVLPYLKSNVEGLKEKHAALAPDDSRKEEYAELIREAATEVSRVEAQAMILSKNVDRLDAAVTSVFRSMDLLTLYRTMVFETRRLAQKLEMLNLKLGEVIEKLTEPKA